MIQVYEEFRHAQDIWGDLSVLPTQYFLTPLKVGEEFSFELDQGKKLFIKLMAIGPLNEATGKRDVFFLLNGEARVVAIQEEVTQTSGGAGANKPARAQADSRDKSQVGAPMSGVVVEVRVEPGSEVKVGDPIVVMSAMSKLCLILISGDAI